jgi:hypothetical protein
MKTIRSFLPPMSKFHRWQRQISYAIGTFHTNKGGRYEINILKKTSLRRAIQVAQQFRGFG